MQTLRVLGRIGKPCQRHVGTKVDLLRVDYAIAVAIVALDVLLMSNVRLTAADPTRSGLLLAIAAVVAAFLGLRRVLPRLCFVGVVVATVVAIEAVSWHSVLPLCFALGTVVARRPPCTGLLAFASAAGVSGVAITAEGGLETYMGQPLATALAVVGYFAPIFVSLGIGLWQRASQLRLAHVRNRQKIVTATAVADERLKLAHDLHDTLAQRVSVMVLQTEGAKRALYQDPVAAEVALNSVAKAGARMAEELREVLGVLRAEPSADDYRPADAAWAEPIRAPQDPGLQSLPKLIEAMERIGVRCTLRITGMRASAIAPEIEVIAYRVVSEALTNVVRHAGCGTQVDIYSHYGVDTVKVTVRDNGRGAPSVLSTLSTRSGLRGMVERVVCVGGTISFSLPPGGGFQVSVVLPVAGCPQEAAVDSGRWAPDHAVVKGPVSEVSS